MCVQYPGGCLDGRTVATWRGAGRVPTGAGRTSPGLRIPGSYGESNAFSGRHLDLATLLGRRRMRDRPALRHRGRGRNFNPATFFRVIGPEPWRTAYVEPSRRPTDGRYGENPNRLQNFYQFQVILKPSPDNVQEMYLQSLTALGIDPRATTSASWRTTGSRPPSGPADWAGRYGSTAWRSPSSPISSRWAASTCPR